MFSKTWKEQCLKVSKCIQKCDLLKRKQNLIAIQLHDILKTAPFRILSAFLASTIGIKSVYCPAVCIFAYIQPMYFSLKCNSQLDVDLAVNGLSSVTDLLR